MDSTVLPSSASAQFSIWQPLIRVYLISYGHAYGPVVWQAGEECQTKLLAYNIRHLPNPPRHLRANATGISKRLQKEFLQNDMVEAFLQKVRTDLLEAIIGEANIAIQNDPLPVISNENLENQGVSPSGERLDLQRHDEIAQKERSVTVTVCCEEGRHRSVAFIEELARRLASFKDGDNLSKAWRLSVDISHRDIGGPSEADGHTEQRTSSKAQKKARQKGRDQKRGLGVNFDEAGDK
ncbi:hypothetical protein N7462_003953 [Penicillium macrosclerotiorum]|uniref:uncharacterized protein n=1 Tax=Penicillium macrosclerotiorum TaxID=303699 RepID=UPI00254680C3|nr:uncharacterized protein N7462_003953 [Penicillium macrosclerotiorum]KAJ5689561.1 hypothetical protein N7462_003953 [Penicillium macrosclerotiorum]